MENVRYFSY